ncbi:MAG: glycosyltransferase [Fibrobacter sp.]|nr:glycosyltransferase [Fibrobacter sp.]
MNRSTNNRCRTPGTLSICMIVKNESALLGRCLQSVREAADEIVVVDTGSSDSTVDIAKSFGAVVIETKWQNDFAQARNISLQHASGQWILWLDADDVVPQESIPGLKELKKRTPECVFAMLIRNERPCNTGTEFMQARMFPNRADIFFERSIHEQMMPSALRLGMKLQNTNVVIEHHGYADPVVLKQKASRNVEMLLKEYESSGGDPVMLLEIADSFLLIEDHESALIWYNKLLKIPKCAETVPAIVSQAYCGLGTIHLNKQEFQKAADLFNGALKLSPWRLDVYYNRAVALEMVDDKNGALQCLGRVIDMQPQPGQVGVDFRAAKIKSFLRMTRILAESGNMTLAEQVITQGLAAFPARQEIKNMAGKIFLKSNRLMDALHEFEKSILIINEGNIDAYIGLCIIYNIAGKQDLVYQTIRSIEPLFKGNKKYDTFKRYISEKKEKYAADESFKQDLAELQKEFFFVL